MFDFFLKGGFLMWPILACSIFAITIILERFYYFYNLRPAVASLVGRVKNLLKEEKIEEAIRLCENLKSPVAHILAIGIHIRKRSHE
ncbi:MAG: MotA/TolQ/ExbB proton channel family protein, partial [Candidatus Margulisiibacteriota bacterium]